MHQQSPSLAEIAKGHLTEGKFEYASARYAVGGRATDDAQRGSLDQAVTGSTTSYMGSS